MKWKQLKYSAAKVYSTINRPRTIRLIFGLSVAVILISHFSGSPMVPSLPKEQELGNLARAEEEIDIGDNDVLATDDSIRMALIDPQSANSTFLTKDSFNILLLGIDNRPGEEYISNTDTIIVANVNKPKQQIALLSVPRDTQVKYRGEIVKINSIARLGGSYQETIRTLEKLLSQKIDGYVISNFEGFKQVVDLVGGITINVEKDMYYDTGDEQDGVINLKQGLQRLNGSEALQYARYRNDALADISRTVRQQAVLKALATEIFQLKNIPKLPQLVQQIYRSVKTDFSPADFLGLSVIALNSDNFQVVSQTLPGNFVIEDEISYWKVDDREVKTVARNFFNEGKTRSMFSDYVQAAEISRQPSPKAGSPKVESAQTPAGDASAKDQEANQETTREKDQQRNQSQESEFQPESLTPVPEYPQEEIIFEVRAL